MVHRQADAAALCFEVLACFPDHVAASALVYSLFCDEWLIYNNRNALQQQIEEWDDRPWQQRRRLALSFRFMSRWEGWYAEYDEGNEYERDGPIDVAELLAAGRAQLLHAYLLGDEACSDKAWPVFTEAMAQSSDQRNAILWVAKCYADLGFFADAAEVLAPFCVLFDDPWANRLLAELRWWRDNAHRIPWLPPSGDGSRYHQMMARIDLHPPADPEIRHEPRSVIPMQRSTWSAIAPSDRYSEAGPTVLVETPAPARALVDWSFLDCDNGPLVELPLCVPQTIREFPQEMADTIACQYRWNRPIPAPTIAPRYKLAESSLCEADAL